MDFSNYKYISNDEYNKFIDLFYNEESYSMKANSKKNLKKYVRENKLNTLVRALYLYLYFTRNHFNSINRPPDTPPQTPKPPVEVSDESSDDSDESSDDEVLVPEKKQEIKPKISLLEKAIGTLPVFQLHGKAYPDEFNKINDDDLSIDEKNIIASKILNYKIY
jgi:hypothetical protein